MSKMGQADQNSKAKSIRKKVKQIHITFHNPNTTEEMVKHLTNLILKNYTEKEIVSTVNNEKGDHR